MITIRQQLQQYNNTASISSRCISSSIVLSFQQQQQQQRRLQKCKLLLVPKIRSCLSQNQQQYRRSIIYHNYSTGSTNIRETTVSNSKSNNNNNNNQNQQIPLTDRPFIQFVYQSLIRWYTSKLETHPYIIKGITSGIIAALGDITCQYITTKTNTNTSTETSITNTTNDMNDTNHDDNDTIDTSSPIVKTSTSPIEPSFSSPLVSSPSVSSIQQQKHEQSSSVSSIQQDQQQQKQQQWDYLRTIRFFILGSLYVAPLCHLWYNALAKWYPIQRVVTASTTTTSNINTIRPLLQRVLYDQFIFTPIFLIGWLSSLKTIEEYMYMNHRNDILQPMNHGRATTTTTIDTTSTIKSETKIDNDNCNDNNQTTINEYSTIIQSNILFIWNTYYTNVYNIISNIYDQLIVPILYSNWILWIPVQLYNFYYISTKYQVLFSNCIALIWNIYLSYITSLSSSSSSKKDNKEN